MIESMSINNIFKYFLWTYQQNKSYKCVYDFSLLCSRIIFEFFGSFLGNHQQRPLNVILYGKNLIYLLFDEILIFCFTFLLVKPLLLTQFPQQALQPKNIVHINCHPQSPIHPKIPVPARQPPTMVPIYTYYQHIKNHKYNSLYLLTTFILVVMFEESSSQLNESPKKAYYCFKPIDSEKVIGLASGKEEKGDLIIGCNFAQDSQCFLIVPESDDFHIKCKLNSLYLTVENTNNGSRVFCTEKSQQPNQKFRIEASSPGSKEYIIYTFCGKVLEANNETKSEGISRVIQNQYDGSIRQKWSLHDFKDVTFDS